MKEFKKKIVPQTETEVCVGVTCDFCGVKGKDGWDSSEWYDKYYCTNETEISVTTTVYSEQANHYPSGGIGERFKCDMCPQCFKEKLFPFLQSIALSNVVLEYKDVE